MGINQSAIFTVNHADTAIQWRSLLTVIIHLFAVAPYKTYQRKTSLAYKYTKWANGELHLIPYAITPVRDTSLDFYQILSLILYLRLGSVFNYSTKLITRVRKKFLWHTSVTAAIKDYVSFLIMCFEPVFVITMMVDR